VSRETVRLEGLAADGRYSLIGGPFGSKLTSADYVDEGIPVIRGSNLNGGRYLDESEFVFVSEQKMRDDLFGNMAYPGDIVFTQRGTLGQIALIPENARFQAYVISQSQMKLTADPLKADKRFIYYYFSSREAVQKILNQNSSSGVPHINLTSLRAFLVPRIPVREQTKIADILSAYDDLIENNRRRIALLEEAARLLYREWFVHFRFPGHEHVKIIDGIPEGGERWTLSEVADVRLGKMLDEKKNRGELRPYLANVNVRWGRFEFDSLREMRFEPHEVKKYGVMPGDIVMCEGGEPGRCAIWKDQVPGMMLQKALHRIRAHEGLDPQFLYHCLSFMAKSGQLAGLFTGATIKHLPREKLITVAVLVPPKRLVQGFVEQVAPMEAQIGTLEAASRRAAEARDLILPRLMNGEIAV
jgi:type I restriction enzyme S subunit